ncbi:DEAD/DEAH box helicase [Methanoplanus endosymbiosus]|uniref:DEAD/DEAH box helicase n=1 Tax=Methanoplanus endosymbiosus TaxID=33865 RepID=A0A9E7TKD7_9EURY|nr:DEAD/DEAH box helicase [Methanoplanus endosymbiosus]UUX92639.1 DEAD/DEAH box helicase [Methanoplanus endosymbiosus]
MTSSVRNYQEEKRLLKRTWNAFFLRYNRMTEIQSMAVPVVLKGRNAIVISSTASGKTEAIIAPICERILRKRLTGLSVLYITPTRALANDLKERLSDILAQLEITIDLKTGDSPYISWTRLPDIIITTPESLDSMICRHPDALTSLEALVIDEIHAIDGTYRGDQLRILIARLKEISEDFSIYAVSATVDDPLAVAERYMKNPEVITAHKKQELMSDYCYSVPELCLRLNEERLKKVLVFCNSRRKTEYIAGEFKKFRNDKEVFVHHGSLKKSVRHETEDCLRTITEAVCVSTGTLEIGLDLGDIDAVILAEPPGDSFTFIQRIGRCGRRTGKIRVFMLADQMNRPKFEEIVSGFYNGAFGIPDYRRDDSVMVQQIFSVLFSRPQGLNREYFYDLFADFCEDKNQTELIINHLIDSDCLHLNGSKLSLSEEIMNLGESGKIHSNIPESVGMTVIDVKSEKEIGEIYISTENLSKSINFILAGKIWEIVRIEKFRIFAKAVKKGYGKASFPLIINHGSFCNFLPEFLRE